MNTKPRLYPKCESVDWESRIIYDTDDYLIMDKPSGIPCHATSDNYVQNTLYSMQKKIGIELYLPHRLDVDTSGILVMCKSKHFLVALNNTIKQQQVVKRYKALLAYDPLEMSSSNSYINPNAFQAGCTWKCFLKKSTTCPKVFTYQACEDSIHCVSKLVSSTHSATKSKQQWLDSFEIDDPKYNDEYSGQLLASAIHSWMVGGDRKQDVTLREVELELITGRTHQVRGQVSVLCDHSCHVAGDNMYHGLTSSSNIDPFYSSPYLALQATSISFGKLSMPKIKLTKRERQDRRKKRELEKMESEMATLHVGESASCSLSTNSDNDDYSTSKSSDNNPENVLRSYSIEKTWWEGLVKSHLCRNT